MKQGQRIELRSRHADVILSILSILRPSQECHQSDEGKNER